MSGLYDYHFTYGSNVYAYYRSTHRSGSSCRRILWEVFGCSCRLLLGRLYDHGSTAQMLKYYVMPIHTKNGATVCTPDGFAMKQRIERLKRELRINRKLNNI
ncbi:hypothetical protein [Shigella phage ESh6]|nr:hypothetical protein [Shigella phage ESh6]